MASTPALIVDGRQIGANHPPYFIADIAANHDGDIERAKDLIYLCAEAGANAAKFQHFQADSIVSDHGFRSLGRQTSHQAHWNQSVFHVYQNATLDPDWTPILRTTCDEANITFLTSPYSIELVDHVDPFVPAYKIGSGDITWTEIIDHIASKGKPIFLATGASTLNDVEEAVLIVRKQNNRLCLMQCNTSYTADPDNFKHIHLNVLRTYKERFPDLVLGLSDHTIGHSTVLGAIALGASVIEKHFTDNPCRIGPDHGFSVDPKSWREMVDRSLELTDALGGYEKFVTANESETVVIQRRSLRAARDIRKGCTLTRLDLVVLRPCTSSGLLPSKLHSIIGMSANRDIVAGEEVTWAMLE